ncbi:MAG: GntR family transcriptional regulator [Saprospiraceae bacterium]|nr:GntR family transcriptional regulator [Saprospiraceae bacterium]MBK7811505.1 GntR family transcriptional regulator [Saprospiraceae bacterium]MBK9631251.1 GntR family transcriptional regulator [Saprospiraceae bacterium]
MMDFRKQQPIYMQIADVILEDVLNKKLTDGDKIPSVREMALHVQVNPNTVQRSYQWLQDENIIHQKRGIGFYLSEEVYLKTIALKKDEFIKEVLPDTVRQMKLLGIDLEELKKYVELN